MNHTTRSLACGICLGISLGFGAISDIAAKPSRPAAAASGAQILGSFSGGHQIFSGGDSITFDVEVSSSGKYALTAKVVTVQDNPKMQLVANNAPPVEIALPYTIGKWAQTPAAEVTLALGKNTLRLNRPKDSRGLAIKEFTLTQVK